MHRRPLLRPTLRYFISFSFVEIKSDPLLISPLATVATGSGNRSTAKGRLRWLGWYRSNLCKAHAQR